MDADAGPGARLILGREALHQLMHRLTDDGWHVVGPKVENGAVVLAQVHDLDDLPFGVTTEQDAGSCRLLAGGHPENGAGPLLADGVPAQPWKRYLYPPSELLSRLRRQASGFSVDPQAAVASPAYALFGMRPCDLNALRALDAALGASGAADTRYMGRRNECLIIVFNCTHSTAACFCASMDTGPRAKAGFDLALTELADADGGERYLVTSGSVRGAALLDCLAASEATSDDLAGEAAAIEDARTSQQRYMVPDVASLLQRNLEHRHWEQIARRCLGCANCTLVCPTCFCTTVEDTTDLAGNTAERWRKWDSCFTVDFSYIHGGSIRQSGAARYRQWMTHKLSFWWQQFDMSGCVGCGRCITWCPVGIDITEEARILRDSEEARILRDSEGGAER